jgi:hypothetical protein
MQEYKANPKKAHDGTIEYLSRDAHIGRWLVRLSFCFLLFPHYKNKIGTHTTSNTLSLL